MDDRLFLDPLAAPAVPPAAAAQTDTAAPAAAPPTGPLHADVPLAVDRAIEAFTEYPHLWWPLDLRRTGAEGHVEFTGGALSEEGTDGTVHEWAQLESVEPGELVLLWAGRDTDGGAGAPVDVHFDSNNGQERTMVTVRTEDGTARQDWELLLTGFARFTGGTLL